VISNQAKERKMSDAELRMIAVDFPEHKSPEEMLSKITEFLKSGAERCGKEFTDPEDDWIPMYLVVFEKGDARLITSTLDKHILVNLIAMGVSNAGAVGIGQLNSSWMRMQEDKTPPEGSIAGKPGSEEGLMLALYSRTNWWIEWAPIERDGKNPPSLGSWKKMMERKEGEEVSGMMFDPLLRALRKN
jgi:hypothetical protein